MNYEIEMKAWVREPEAVRARLEELTLPGRYYDKTDRYFSKQLPDGSAAVSTLFRLRNDGEHSIVTYKDRTVVDGTERNRESEFSVDDADAFVFFAEALGFHLQISKRKRGRQYHYTCIECPFDILVEFSLVEGLGEFVELEVLLPDTSTTGIVNTATEEIRKLLNRIGIESTDIETRRYTQMLQERAR